MKAEDALSAGSARESHARPSTPAVSAGPAPVIVVVEDETQIARFVRLALESEGCRVTVAPNAARGRIDTGTRRPDLVVLDLGLPDGDGVDLIRDLRSWSDVPIVVLSARSAEADKIAALDAGADDYLAKPFGAGELLARVRAQLRRRAGAAGASTTSLRFGAVQLDLARRLCWRDGVEIHLTPIEYRLLAYLVAHPERVLTHRQILAGVWGPGHTEDTHYVRIYLGHLRRKLETDPAQPAHLLTASGVGYRFRP